MDTVRSNQITMLKTVSDYLDDNKSIWNSMAPFQTAFTAYEEKISHIDEAAQKQEIPSGATMDKASTRDALEDVLFLASEALSVLAHNGGNQDLTALTNLTRTALGRMSDVQLSNRAASIAAEANSRKTELATLQVTPANLDELNDALTDFNNVKNDPRMAIVDRKTQTESLPELIREAVGDLRNQIDPMVNLFSRSHPDFVAGYRSARLIIDRAATRKIAKPAAGSSPSP